MTEVKTNLYRSVAKEDFPDGPIVNHVPVVGVLYPDFEAKSYRDSKGRLRERGADVTLHRDDGKLYVRKGGGTSLFDRPNVFGTARWHNFVIPEGTPVPSGLTVREQDFNTKLRATHHQIEATNMMEIDAFKGALDNLARAALVRSLALASGSSI